MICVLIIIIIIVILRRSSRRKRRGAPRPDDARFDNDVAVDKDARFLSVLDDNNIHQVPVQPVVQQKASANEYDVGAISRQKPVVQNPPANTVVEFASRTLIDYCCLVDS